MFHQYASKISELGLFGITLIKLSRVVNLKPESMEVPLVSQITLL